MGEEEKLLKQINDLRAEHKLLDGVAEEGNDQLKLQRLKKRKLWIKDEMARLQSYLHNDLSA